MTLTLNKLLVYTVRLATILFTLGFVIGCGGEPVECDDKGDCMPPNPMKNLIGSQTSNMIRTANISTAASGLADPKNQVNNLQQNELEPGEYTIQFQVYPPSDGNGFACYAIINWKVKGQQIVRKISVYSGAVISGVAEAVDVQLVDVSGIGTTGYPPASPQPGTDTYKVAATLSRGSRANIQQPPILLTQLDAQVIAGAGGVTWLVPQDAGVISALVLTVPHEAANPADSLQNIVAQQIMSGGLPAQVWYPPTQPNGWVPITPLVTAIQVGNRNGVDDPPLGNVIFGVEG